MHPEYLYKYRPFASECDIEFTRQIVCDNTIYFAPPCTFNDPFDSRPAFTFDAPFDEMKAYYRRMCSKQMPQLTERACEEELEKILADPATDLRTPQGQQRIQQLHSRILAEEVGVLCLSSERDHILMWSHYADCHKGICLRFDARAAFLREARPIGYEQRRELINPFRDRDEDMAAKTFLMKSRHWLYEGEWRAVRYEGPGPVEFAPEALTGIVLGANASKEAEERAREWASRRRAPLELLRAYPDQQDFRLHIRPLDHWNCEN
ncbi:DUF2971 domain-containing protein [Pseudoduganella albidiflava]|uniref:DUF2971 domain-containing protein n=1 Tax=Pseudoduganella albidiflava TaxID=321983 RepID=A0A411WRU1_9BURK|nr:DUF2971 domain-containing protein [Pseudoduganella albidiflava]QBH99500.1 DUF2971 domain-containing protein [Pseudoduganella albidiflava]GGY45342.1 hypothetical protein GCM10007387_29190 [Pseudoduganella albidiflava]